MCTLIFSQCWNFLKKEGHLKKFFQDSQCINTSVEIVIYAISVYTFLVDVSGSHIASRRLSNVPRCCIENSSCVECMSYWTVVLLSNVQFSQPLAHLWRVAKACFHTKAESSFSTVAVMSRKSLCNSVTL